MTTCKGSDWSFIIQVQTNKIFPSDTYEVLLDDNGIYDILHGNISQVSKTDRKISLKCSDYFEKSIFYCKMI